VVAAAATAQEKPKPWCRELSAEYVVGNKGSTAEVEWMQDTYSTLDGRYDMRGLALHRSRSTKSVIENLQQNKVDLAVIPAKSLESIVGNDVSDQGSRAKRLEGLRLKLVETAETAEGSELLFLMSNEAFEMSYDYRDAIAEVVEESAPTLDAD
jgi:hypothetical protein